MYRYNRKYIEQQVIGPQMVINTIIFLFFTILMITVSGNSMDLSSQQHTMSDTERILIQLLTRPVSHSMDREPHTTRLDAGTVNAPGITTCLQDPMAIDHHLFVYFKDHAFAAMTAYQMEQVFENSATISPYQKKARPFHPIIRQVAQRYEVEPAIIKAIIMAESSFNPRAVSHKGAQGLMQLMPRTARYLGVEDSFDPEHNINGGVKYFKRLLDRFDGDVQLALAAYNAGSRNVRKYNGVPPFKATQVYIKKVLRYYEEYKTT